MLGEFTLRPHQEKAIVQTRQAISQLLAKGLPPRVVVVAPCGSGKTVLSAAVMGSGYEKGRSSVFLAHGRQLIFQKSRTLDRCGIPHGVLMAGLEDQFWNARCIVASSDTYWARSFETSRLHRLSPDMWIVDEAHAGMGQGFLSMLPKDKIIIGLTATPAMSNGRGLGEFYQALVQPVSYSELIDLRLIVPARVIAPWAVDTRGLAKTNDGDWSWEKVAGRFQEGTLVGDVVETWLEKGEDRPTAVFAANVPHSIALCEQFNRAGVSAVHIDADTPQEERDDAFAAVRAGRVRVLCNFGVLTVGFDLPDLSCAVLGFSTASLIKFLQVVGRVLRPADGKVDALVIDHGDNVRRHGWPTADHEWHLNPQQTVEEREIEIAERDKKPREPISCAECGCMRESGPKCPNCGKQHVRQGHMARTVDGRLEEIIPKQVRKNQDADEDQRAWLKCLAISAYRGMSVNQAAILYKKFRHTFPPGHLRPMPERHLWSMKVVTLYPKFCRKKT